MFPDHFSLLFQNLMLEERSDIRELSFSALCAGIEQVCHEASRYDVPIEDWYEMVMTPVGAALDPKLFIGATAGHNIDKHMMAGDMSLVTRPMVLQTRIAAAKALARLKSFALGPVSFPHLTSADEQDVDLKLYLSSGSAHQIFMASVVIQEWADNPDNASSDGSDRIDDLSNHLVSFLTSPPATYDEMGMLLSGLYSNCRALLDAFSTEGKLAKGKIPDLPKRVDALSESKSAFSLATAQLAIGQHFDILVGLLSKSVKETIIKSLLERRKRVLSSIGHFSMMKERYDVQVSAAVAGALIALRVMPPKLGLVIKGIMDSVKVSREGPVSITDRIQREEIEILQQRSASSLASLVEYCNSPLFNGKFNPCDKVVKNLFTFLYQDMTVTPIFSTSAEGIITLQEETPVSQRKGTIHDLPDESEMQIAARVTRRGAVEAFRALAKRFGAQVFDGVPRFWEGISASLLASFTEGER